MLDCYVVMASVYVLYDSFSVLFILYDYVGYIPCEVSFLFYDGLPSDSPILKRYSISRFHGDISLLLYFPIDNNAQ